VAASHRRAHARIAAGLFVGLGLQVGAWAVLIPELVASRGLSPAELGAGLAVMAVTSIGALAAAGPLADRIGRRPLAVAGAAGFAASFVLLAAVEAPAALWPTLAVYGVASGCLDLAANAVGSDYERTHRVRAMIRLHAGFSGAAAAGALLAGAVGPDTYWIVAAAYAALAAAATVARLPPHEAVAHDAPAGAPHETAVAAGESAAGDEWLAAGGSVAGDESLAVGGPLARDESSASGGRLALLRTPAIAVAVALCTLCFFGDGAIEGYAALFLRDVLASGALLTGAALAAFHAASLTGRLLFARLVDARGERFVLTVAGLLASAAMVVVVAARVPALAGVGLLVVGLALAPVVPTALSLAGRNAPGRSATAVSLVTTVGYSAFVLGPLLVGLLAGATSLRVALVPVVGSTAMIAVLARRVR
jgi:MFS family permease